MLAELSFCSFLPSSSFSWFVTSCHLLVSCLMGSSSSVFFFYPWFTSIMSFNVPPACVMGTSSSPAGAAEFCNAASSPVIWYVQEFVCFWVGRAGSCLRNASASLTVQKCRSSIKVQWLAHESSASCILIILVQQSSAGSGVRAIHRSTATTKKENMRLLYGILSVCMVPEN